MKKYIKWILLGVLIVVGISLIKLPSTVQNIAVARLETILGRRVSSGKIKYNYPRNILYMEDFKIFEEDNSTIFIAFESLNVNIDIIPLLKKTFYVQELTFVKPNIKIDYHKGTPNYQSILDQFEKSKKEDAVLEETDTSESFIKNYELKNLVIESFTLFYEDQVITASNNFTFETPELLYRDGIFSLDSTVDFHGKGKIDLDFEYNDAGDFKGNISTFDLLLDDKLYITKTLYDLNMVEGTLSSSLSIAGNTVESDYSIKGDLKLNRLMIDSNKQDKLLQINSLSGGIDFSFGDNKYFFKDIKIIDGNLDTEKIIAFVDELTREADSVDEVEKAPKDKLEININKAEIKNVDILTTVGRFTDVDAVLKNFTGKKQDEVGLDMSFTYNDKTAVKLNTLSNLLDGLNINEKTIGSKGRITIDGENINFIDTFLPEDREYNITSNGFTYSGDYDYTYPNIQIDNNISIEVPLITNITPDFKEISGNLFTTSNLVDYNLTDKIYKVRGDIDLQSLMITGLEDKTFISTGSLSGKIDEISQDNFELTALDINRLNLDLTKLPSKEKEDSKEAPSDFPIVIIDRLNISESLLIHKDFNLKVNLKAGNLGTPKGSSDIDFRGFYNNSPVNIKGKLIRQYDLKKASHLDYISFNGRSDIRSFDLSEINDYTGNEYELEGNLNLVSNINYKKNNITTKNTIDASNIFFKLDNTKFAIKELNSENTLSVKEADYFFGGNITYSKTSMDSDEIGITLAEGRLVIDSFTPKDIVVAELRFLKPKITILDTVDSQEKEIVDEAGIDEAIETKESEASKEKPSLTVKEFSVEEGRINYKAENLRYSIKNIEVEVSDFTTKKHKDFNGKILGDLTGIGSIQSTFISSLEEEWNFKPTSLNIDGKLSIKDLNLLDFKDYFETKLPNEIRSGKFNYSGDIKLEKGSFKGENIFQIDSIYIGEETSVDSAVPLKLAVGILRDRKGNLKLDVPVSGDFNDPKFRLSRVILQAIKNILIKAVTSPVNILSKAFNLGTDEALSLEYEYLEIQPKSGEATLDKIAKILKEKRNISMVFTIFSNRGEEKIVLNESLKEKKIFKRDTKDEKLEEAFDDIMSERKEYIEEYFDSLLLSRRVRVEISNIPRDTPIASIDVVIEE